ncbi:MAG TPA: hypothetical protein VIO64_05020 [Pseudobacteroides sp.]|uniref:DUF6115 domain-containing protein n=1 Tax=Pseudobacteroides sp. TaxID=1968840 RepID=UPI002F93F2E7
MIQFYISVIFIGIILVVISFVLILYDRKKAYDYSKGVDNKKAELLVVIKDAEEMIEELNSISGYILDNMDSKSNELKDTLISADEKIKEIKLVAAEQSEHIKNEHIKNETIKASSDNKNNGNCREVIGIQAIQLKNFTEEFNTLRNAKPKVRAVGGSRYREVISLSESGLGETEIAKKLNIGKGEIQLILGMSMENGTVKV